MGEDNIVSSTRQLRFIEYFSQNIIYFNSKEFTRSSPSNMRKTLYNTITFISPRI